MALTGVLDQSILVLLGNKALGHILVADDDVAVLALVRRILTQQGFEVATAGTGANLVRAWQILRSPVVLSDANMPGVMDGVGACRIIRALDPKVRIFLMSGDPDSLRRAETVGLKVALRKPFLVEDVVKWAKNLGVAIRLRR